MATLPALGRLADTLLPEGLEAFIVKHRTDQKSFDVIARELWLATDKQIDTSGVTVKAWHDRLGIGAKKKTKKAS